MTTAAVTTVMRRPEPPTATGLRRRPPGSLCLLCGAVLGRASARGEVVRGVCGGCAERLELELTASDSAACPECGRHQELCAVMPCGRAQPEPRPDNSAKLKTKLKTKLETKLETEVKTEQRTEPQTKLKTVAWVPIADIDETPGELNARQTYDTPSLIELAASIKEHGILQPLCVRPAAERYVLVFGNRRLRAARRAGIDVVPCLILPAADDRAFLLNVIENLHRRQLSGAERVRAIERLAATRLGVRELGRRTGFAPSTISRWLKIDRCPALKQALETETLDIGRAKLLADAPESALGELIPFAAAVSRADLARRIATLRGQSDSAPDQPYASSTESGRRLQRAMRLLESISGVTFDDFPMLERMRRMLDGLLAGV